MEQDPIAVGPATKPSYKWTLQKQCLVLMPGGKIKKQWICVNSGRNMNRKGIKGPHSSSHRHGNPAKNPSLFAGPWRNTSPALGPPFCLLFLVRSAGSTVDFVAVSQTCSLLS